MIEIEKAVCIVVDYVRRLFINLHGSFK